MTSGSQLRWYRPSRFVYQHAQPVLRAHCSPNQQSLPGRAPRHHLLCQLVISVSPLVCRFWRNTFPTPRTWSLLFQIPLSHRLMHTLAANFSLGAFGLDDGKRVGIFQRTEQFSDIVRFLNSFLLLRFPGGCWSSICVSHNVRTLLRTDAGNKPGSNNFTISLGNFCGGEVWISPPLSSSSPLFPAPSDSSSKDFSSSGMQQGELVDTFETALTFPCEHVRCTCPFSGERWVLTAYTCRGLATFTPEQTSYIRSLGFPLEVSASAEQKEAPRPALTSCFPANTGSPGFFLDICCGANAPLSESLRKSGIQCVCVDALGSEPLDLLNDRTYDSLLRLAFSGIVRMAHAAPARSIPA